MVTVFVISSDPPFKEGNVIFTKVSIFVLLSQNYILMFITLKMFIFNNLKPRKTSIHISNIETDQGFNGTVVNRALPLH